MEPRQGAPKLQHEGMPGYPSEARLSHDNPGEYLNDGRLESTGERPVQIETESLPPVLPTVPSIIPQMTDDAAQQAVVDDASANPASAADEDLIEKEWVDKAKKIIEETKEDPYKRELEIGKLQRDYIRKRYGREIGEPGGA